MNLDFIEQRLGGIGALQAVGPAHSVTSFDDVRDALPQALYHPVRETAQADGLAGRALKRSARFALITIADHAALDAVRGAIISALNGYRPSGATPVRFVEGEVIEAVGQTIIWRDYFEFSDTIGG